MSYESVTPAFYQYKQPGTPWHPGSRGWSQAPVPGWGMNPNLIGSPRLAVNGCTSCRGTGLGVAWLPVAVYGGFFLAIVGAVTVVHYVTERRFRRRGYRNNRRRHRRMRATGKAA